jgi:hypothetical protein
MWRRAVRSGGAKRRVYAGESKSWSFRPRTCESRPRLLKKTDLPAVLDLDDRPSSGNHGYSVGVQCLFLRLVLTGLSLRAVPRALEILSDALGLMLPIPHWTTGRLWLLRLGLSLLNATLPKADDWAWLTDHSVQIGKEKCLVILGIRLKDLPKPGDCLQHSDLHLVSLELRKSWTRQEVDDALEASTQRTGVPRVIVDDHGVDLSGGVSFFQQRHTETIEIYDAKHKAACLLNNRLSKDPRWQEFQRGVAQTRCAIQQTEVAFLVPPAPKAKARFMNLAPLLQWAQKTLVVLRRPEPQVSQWVSRERLEEKLGWLRGFKTELRMWGEWQQVVNVTVEFVNRRGIYPGASKELKSELKPHQRYPTSRSLAKELLAFVTEQEDQLRTGERVPGSTEVLESCFGRFKNIEKQQARGGFTSLILGFGALLAHTSVEAVAEAMHQTRTRGIFEWCATQLGKTLFGKRKLAFAECATKTE